MKLWLKITAVILLVYAHIGGFFIEVPRLHIVNESIRATYFHVPMWFTMIFLYSISLYYSIVQLRKPSLETDTKAAQFTKTGMIFGFGGIFTGMLWANYTWGSPWNGDPKQNGSAIATLVYLAYFVLRASVDNQEQRARLSAVYNIFAFAAMIPLIFILPSIQDSLHPGSGGNPGFNMYKSSPAMRLVLYPATVGWFIVGYWLATLNVRINVLEEKINE